MSKEDYESAPSLRAVDSALAVGDAVLIAQHQVRRNWIVRSAKRAERGSSKRKLSPVAVGKPVENLGHIWRGGQAIIEYREDLVFLASHCL